MSLFDGNILAEEDRDRRAYRAFLRGHFSTDFAAMAIFDHLSARPSIPSGIHVRILWAIACEPCGKRIGEPCQHDGATDEPQSCLLRRVAYAKSFADQIREIAA